MRIHPIQRAIRATPDAVAHDTEPGAHGRVEQQINDLGPLRLGQVVNVVGTLERLAEAEAVNGLEFLVHVYRERRGLHGLPRGRRMGDCRGGSDGVGEAHLGRSNAALVTRTTSDLDQGIAEIFSLVFAIYLSSLLRLVPDFSSRQYERVDTMAKFRSWRQLVVCLEPLVRGYQGRASSRS